MISWYLEARGMMSVGVKRPGRDDSDGVTPANFRVGVISNNALEIVILILRNEEKRNEKSTCKTLD